MNPSLVRTTFFALFVNSQRSGDFSLGLRDGSFCPLKARKLFDFITQARKRQKHC